MEFLSAVFSYLLSLVIGILLSVLNLVPLGTILNLSSLTNNVVFKTIFSFLYTCDAHDVGVGTWLVFLTVLFFGFWISFFAIRFLIRGFQELLFKQKYDGIKDEDADVLLSSESSFSGMLKAQGIIQKGFLGELIGRIHSYKENILGLDTTAQDKVKYFGPLAFLLGFLFGIFNSKELKKYNFFKGLVLSVIVLFFVFLIGKLIGTYYVDILQTDEHKLVKLEDNVSSIKVIPTNIGISTLSDYTMFFLLTHIFLADQDYSGKKLTIKQYIDRNFESYLEKYRPETKEELEELPLYLKVYYQAKLSGENYSVDDVVDYFDKLPFIVKASHYLLLKSKAENQIGGLYYYVWDLSNLIYNYDRIYNLYKTFSSNSGLMTIEKFIYILHLMPVYHRDSFINLEDAKKFFGDYNPWHYSVVKQNNPLLGEDKQSQIKQNTKENVSVVNPRYLLRVFGIFPVTPISTNKLYNIIYYIFLTILSIFWFLLILMLMGAGRFIYLFLLKQTLDEKQKEIFQIEYNVEFIDTIIRMLVFFVLYYFILTILTTKLY